MDATGIIHYAQYAESPRLQRVLQFMLHGQPRTGREIINGADVNNVSVAACELRLNGFDLECIKQNNPPTYRLNNPDDARQRSRQLLSRESDQDERKAA